MPPKKPAAPKKSAQTAAKKPMGRVTETITDTLKKDAVQPITNTTNVSSEQHNSAAISEEAIRQRAYELYEGRGRTQGNHHEDWFRAEQEIRDRYRRTS